MEHVHACASTYAWMCIKGHAAHDTYKHEESYSFTLDTHACEQACAWAWTCACDQAWAVYKSHTVQIRATARTHACTR